MNKLLLQIATCAFAFSTLAVYVTRGDDVALLSIKLPDQKPLKHVIIEFDDADAPQTVANFKKLAQKHFYNGMTFHRIFPHLLVQAGDPFSKGKDRTKVGTGGPGYTLPPEIHRKHTSGAVAMARLPDNINPARRSNGSQFYICLKPMPNLDRDYTVFANVAAGMDVLDEISTAPTDSNDNPLRRYIIKEIRILPRAEAEKRSVVPVPKPKKEKGPSRPPGEPVTVNPQSNPATSPPEPQ